MFQIKPHFILPFNFNFLIHQLVILNNALNPTVIDFLSLMILIPQMFAHFELYFIPIIFPIDVILRGLILFFSLKLLFILVVKFKNFEYLSTNPH